MKCIMFYHSLVSDWNHGNAHFLRGIVKELQRRGHEVEVYEPVQGWSYTNLLKEENGRQVVDEFYDYYPSLRTRFYNPARINLNKILNRADLVIVHEFNEPDLVKKIGEHRRNSGAYKLLFHDTHHRSVSKRNEMKQYDLQYYDGVLAFGNIISEIYQKEGWAKQTWTWHEAADTDLFVDSSTAEKKGDLVWIGNWGDEERTRELHEYVIEPVKALGISATVYGVRYPKKALRTLKEAGIRYGGYLPNFKVPEVFAQFKVTVHVPRKFYAKELPGIPTIRPFEAMACGIPLICAPWQDREKLFHQNKDYLLVKDSLEMQEQIQNLLLDNQRAKVLAEHANKTIMENHTCKHRVDELMHICKCLGMQVEDKEINLEKINV